MKNGKMRSDIDNLEIAIMEAYPKKGTKIKGIVQIVHDMGEDRKRYSDFMKYLNDQGYITIIHDHRGHGESVEKAQELGYLYKGGIEGLIEDTHQLTMSIKKHHKELPIYLLGQGFGTLIARSYIQTYDSEINGLILLSPPYQDKNVKLQKFTAGLIKLFKGPYHRSPYMQYILFGKHNRPFEPTESENDWICSDKKVVEAYDKNPNYGFTFTIQGFSNLLKLLERTYHKTRYQVKKEYLPILILAGGRDSMLGGKDNFKKTVTFLKKVGYKQVIVKVYSKDRHEVLNELNKKEVYQDIVKFINQEVEESETELL